MNRTEQWNNLRALLKKSEKKAPQFNTLKATKKRITLTTKLFRKAYNEDSVVAWRTSFVPTEILFALDIIPFPAESIVSMFASAGLTSEILSAAEENNHSRDTCSFLRGTIGASILGYFPTPDFLIATSLYCDGSAKTFHSLSRFFNKDFYYIDIPYHYKSKGVRDYVAKQLEEITLLMAKKSGKIFHIENLMKAIEYSNEATKFLRKAFDLRKNHPSPILGGEAIDYAVMLAHTWGSKEIVDVYKLLYEELKERVESSKNPVDKERFRILWRQLRPYYTDWLFEYLELKNKAIIVAEEANYIHWDELDPRKPFFSLAEKLLSNPPLGPYQRWLDHSLRFMRNFKIDGVIEFSQWGCRHLNSGTQFLKEELQKLNIPLLVLDGDCVDQRDFSQGQVKTRIDAFLEILQNKKKGE